MILIGRYFFFLSLSITSFITNPHPLLSNTTNHTLLALNNSRIHSRQSDADHRPAHRALQTRLARRRHSRTEDRHAYPGDGWIEWGCVCSFLLFYILLNTNPPLPHFKINRHRLRIEILSLPFPRARYCGAAGEEGAQGDGEAEKGSEEGEAFRGRVRMAFHISFLERFSFRFVSFGL